MSETNDINDNYPIQIIIEDCDFIVFHKLTAYAEKELKCEFSEKVDDYDSLYYTFTYKEMELILSYHIYDGISLQLVNQKSGNSDKEFFVLFYLLRNKVL